MLEKRSGICRLSELKSYRRSSYNVTSCAVRGRMKDWCVRQELASYVEFSSVNLLEKQYNVPGR